MSDQLFKTLEYITRVVLPAVATLYAGLGALWGFPNVTAVVGTIVAVDTFLGVLLGFAMRAYDASDAKYVGVINPTQNEAGNTMLTLDMGNSDPLSIIGKHEVTFKVNPVQLV